MPSISGEGVVFGVLVPDVFDLVGGGLGYGLAQPDRFMKLYCDLLQVLIGVVGFVLKAVGYQPIHSVFQNGTRLATEDFRGVSRRLS